jgi:hypothetical protein
MGGLEANCRLELEFANGISGAVRLSRDTQLPNRTILEFERGWLRCAAAASDTLELGFKECSHGFEGKLFLQDLNGSRSLRNKPALSYAQSFSMQLNDVIAAVQSGKSPFISGAEGIRSLRIIDQCYSGAKLLAMPWLPEAEYFI